MFRLYTIAILRPTWNIVQVHKLRTQWDPTSFTSMSYTMIKHDNVVQVNFTTLCPNMWK